MGVRGRHDWLLLTRFDSSTRLGKGFADGILAEQSIRWLGFALTEAVAFYTFIFGLIAFFL